MLLDDSMSGSRSFMVEPLSTITAPPERLERALAAFLHQELTSPIVAMTGFLDMLIVEARRSHLDEAVVDLTRMRAASVDLEALVTKVIETPEAIPTGQEAIEGFRKHLRHDLRTPLNTIKGFAAMLVEDLKDSQHRRMLHELRKILATADELRVQIDALVDRTGQSSIEPRLKSAQPKTSIIGDMLSVVAPVDLGSDTIWRGQPSRILIVDDTAANRDLLAPRLLRDGHEVETAENAATALDRLVSANFDLILLDLVMPGMDGFELLCRLKSNLHTRHIPVIMISALDEVESAIRCIEAGAEDYLPKPFNPVLLRARIDASLEKKWLRDRERSHFEEMRVEKQRSEALLLNILPQSIVSRMRNGEAVIADRHADATILFVDLVGFTSLSTQYSPDKVLDLLTKIFGLFDTAVTAHGLEKIKTIGDAYMVAGGLPEPVSDHTSRAAELAIEMLAIVRQLRDSQQIDLQARIGIHAGPVIAGVIGARKLMYDVWGDTVNTASRMETFGAPDRIHVSTEIRRVLGEAFSFEPRGKLDIKGKGMMETYFLIGTCAAID
jgi:adenylate cyclase